ncbi:type II toxin-antitoxin system VapC family toxin (plasmid) [Paracoccus methylovorus]|uniref:Type II toxin-antitoxin system VapC family toxin n=1 Tax=Paracoccus methylovorus TaxID=2812658 RepID=A0ABX7JJW4_9RHOB|nr:MULTISPECIES: type II toxin-antitoxin system VapC family toxin [Paracoccus]QRZ14415.1 type II toxin-antitoxin system VapC family toxin [Paracoccus methylovorus]
MRLLLDTHIVLWAMLDDARLPAGLRETIAQSETLCISAATVWEVAIKSGLGKLAVPADLFIRAASAGAQSLPITWEHAQAGQDLPLHHADPFDRLLIAQAKCEGLTLVSVDRRFREYEVDLIDA